VSAAGGSSAGDYVFHTTFDLTGFNPASANISGQCMVDNLATNVSLNGTTVLTQGTICSSYTNFHAWNILTGFVSGVNTLDFTVHDDGAPVGFRAEVTGTATAAVGAVPEPGTLLISAAGLLLLFCGRRSALQRP